MTLANKGLTRENKFKNINNLPILLYMVLFLDIFEISILGIDRRLFISLFWYFSAT